MSDSLNPFVPNLSIRLEGGEALDVRAFKVVEALSRLFEVKIVAMSPNADFDFESPIGKPASFMVRRDGGAALLWEGVCARIEQVKVEEDGLSTYEIHIAPELWLLTHRRNYRIFQDQSELDIVLAVLGEWGISPELQLDPGSYPKRRYRAQYAESDFHFVSRLLEDAGIAYRFVGDGGTKLTLLDAPNRQKASRILPFVSSPNERMPGDFVTEVTTARQVRPGRYTQSDVDYRKALDYPLSSSSSAGGDVEQSLERYHHNYGSFLWKGGGGDSTPFADDRGPARSNEKDGAVQVAKRLDAQRVDARVVTFRTTAFELRPGLVFSMSGHPRAELASPLLVVETVFEGDIHSKWIHRSAARYTDVDFRPALRTDKPRTLGVESATVTGPRGEEIHTDEFGRVRVHFHWDRQGQNDETSSCWVPVNQPWAGAGFGALNIPRVGQEVLVDFLGADPDRPIVIGRVFTTTTPPPYELPKYKVVSGLRSETYPRKASGSGGQMGGGPAEVTAPVDEPPPPRPRLRVVPLSAQVAGEARAAGPNLGGGTSPGNESAVGSTAVPGAQPGPFGAFPAAPAEYKDAVSRVDGLGPDGQDHTRDANGVVIDDSNKAERVYIQAQKDLAFAVKANLVGAVGANRVFSIHGNDWETIETGFQATSVAKDRSLKVGGKQEHQVVGDVHLATEANYVAVVKESTYVEATTGGQVYKASLGFSIMVASGDAAPTASIIMTPSAIVIDAPKVFINPGPEMMTAIYHGVSPEAAADAAARAQRVKDGADKMVDSYKKNGAIYTEMKSQIQMVADGDPAAVNSVGKNMTGLEDPGEIQDAGKQASQRIAQPPGQPTGNP